MTSTGRPLASNTGAASASIPATRSPATLATWCWRTLAVISRKSLRRAARCRAGSSRNSSSANAAVTGSGRKAANTRPVAERVSGSTAPVRSPAVTGWLDSSQRTTVAPELPYTMGELRYSVANEMAQTLGDLLIRRTHLAFETRDHGAAAAERVATAVARQFGWTSADQQRAIEAYAVEADRVFSTA